MIHDHQLIDLYEFVWEGFYIRDEILIYYWEIVVDVSGNYFGEPRIKDYHTIYTSTTIKRSLGGTQGNKYLPYNAIIITSGIYITLTLQLL